MNISDSGGDGYVCRMDLIQNWKTNDPNSTVLASLLDLQQTQLYQTVQSKCQAEKEAFNSVADKVCLLQQESPMVTYSEFWQSGPANMDGDYSIALDLLYSENFTTVGPSIPCANSCYSDGPGCDAIRPFGLVHYGNITQEDVCQLKWGELDNAYNNLRVCGALAVGADAAVVDAVSLQGVSQKECSDNACVDEMEMEQSSSEPSVASSFIPTCYSVPLMTTAGILLFVAELVKLW